MGLRFHTTRLATAALRSAATRLRIAARRQPLGTEALGWRTDALPVQALSAPLQAQSQCQPHRESGGEDPFEGSGATSHATWPETLRAAPAIGSRSRTFTIVSETVSPANATRPVNISNSTQPNAQMSVACRPVCHAPVRDSCRRPCREHPFTRRHRLSMSATVVPAVRADAFASPKSSTLTLAVRRDLDVGGLQIAVDDALVVRRSSASTICRARRGRRSDIGPAPPFRQRLAIDELEHERRGCRRLSSRP